MITGEIKSQVDRVWDAFWTGGISNPLEVIEQLTYLLFLKGLDETHTNREHRANTTGKPIEKPIFGPHQQHLRWSRMINEGDPKRLYAILVEEAFPFIKGLTDENSAFAKHTRDARFTLPPEKAGLLARVMELLHNIPMQRRDTKGDLYEYLLSKLATAGQNGQFRTPRHIIELMVALTQPHPHDVICDPACGTAGFLVACNEYLNQHHPEILRDPDLRRHYEQGMFHGYDFDSTMLRVAAMNMLLHGVENPAIENRDSLAQAHSDAEQYTLILANPPFAGSLDAESVAKDLQAMVKTRKTELLFLALFLRLLKVGGRAAVIVPDGVLFGSSNAHQSLRRMLVEEQQLQGVISLPSGVFKPYAGVSTAVLLFTRTDSGGTGGVWFYDMQADGFSLDDKRAPIEANDIPDIVARWGEMGRGGEEERKRGRTAQSFVVPKGEIAANGYDLSLNRYKEVVYEAVAYAPPGEILAQLRALEGEIARGMAELEEMLK